MSNIKKTVLLTILFFPSFFAYAQYEPSTVILNPYGADYREPKIYGTGEIIPTTNTTSQSISTEIQNTVTKPTDLFETKKQDTSFFSNLFTQKLKLDVKAGGEACKAGGEKSIPWTLTDRGVSIDTVEELKSVIDQAIHADPRLRRVVIKENILEMYYLQPARVFGLIPVNYLYKVSVDVQTLKTDIQNPKWHSFAKTFHTDVTKVISTNMTSVFTTDTVVYVSKQNLFYKHAVTVSALSESMNLVTTYPFANTFWICFIVPYFVIFLLGIGILFGFLFYLWAKRKQRAYIHRIQGIGMRAPREREKEKDDDTFLDDYMKSKRFTQ